MNHQRGRRPASRRQQQPARRGEAIKLGDAPEFADDGGERATFERLLHRPQQGAPVGRIDEEEPLAVEAESGETRPIERAGLAGAEFLVNDQDGAARPGGAESRGET